MQQCLLIMDYVLRTTVFQLTDLFELKDGARNGELPLMRKTFLMFRLVGGRRPAPRHAQFLKKAYGITSDFVLVR